MSEWRKYRIEDVSSYMADAPFGSNLKTKDYTEEGELVIQGKNIDGRRMRWDDFRYVSKEKFDSLKRHQANLGAIVFPKVGTIGKVGILTQYEDRENYLLSTNTMMFEPDLNKTTSLYVYYFFANPRTRKIIEHNSTSSVQPVFNFTALKNFEIRLPPLPEQKAIAHILGKLDDKIELNRKMNETLEGMAQALFKSWFVDFDPVLDNALAAGNKIPEALHTKAEQRKAVPDQNKLLHTNPELASQFPDQFTFNETLNKWIPEGWEERKLATDINVKHGFAFKGEFFSAEPTPDILLTPGNFKIGGGFKSDKFKYYSGEVPEDYILEKGDLIITMTDLSKAGDTLGYPALIPESKDLRYLHNQRLGLVEYKNDLLAPMFLYYTLCDRRYRAEIVGGASGTTVKHTSPTKIMGHWYLYPSTDLVQSFEGISNQFESKKEKNNLETETLTKLRDTLLPQLISGKVRVPEEVVERFNKGS